MRGRKPQPTRQKKLAGNPGRRKLNDAEPQLPTPSEAFDVPPAELEHDTIACVEWRRSAPMLRTRRVITDGDRGVLIALCQQWSIYQQAIQKWSTMGMIVVDAVRARRRRLNLARAGREVSPARLRAASEGPRARRHAGFPYRFDLPKAERFFRFAEKLKHYKGEWAGQPIVLQPYQKFRLGSLFGWVHVETGLRRFRTSYNEIPRKNGKSLEAAVVLLYVTFYDGEPGAEGYCIATKRDQAQARVQRREKARDSRPA
jgi:phage terminase small subunit